MRITSKYITSLRAGVAASAISLPLLFAACSDVGDRDNPLDAHGVAFVDDEESSSSVEESSSSVEESSSSKENESSSSKEKESSSSQEKSSSSSSGDIEIVTKPSSSSMTIIENPEPTSSADVEITVPVTGLGSCAPATATINKGESVKWKFSVNATMYRPVDFAKATYEWTFEGGAPATGTGATTGDITYAASGEAQATLIVTMPDGASETIQCSPLQVNDDPTSSAASSSSVQSSSSVSTWKCGDSTLVRDAVEYKTVEIAGMCFTQENMRFKPSLGKSLCYGETDENCVKYGRLYDYQAATYACPSGWRLPTAEEYEVLVDFYHNDDENTVGKHFKATSGWSDANGDDDLEFTALPAGICDEDKECEGQGDYAYWWTSNEAKKNYSHYTLNLTAFNDKVTTRFGLENTSYVSVRCIKD